jgi:hypothetical protein
LNISPQKKIENANKENKKLKLEGGQTSSKLIEKIQLKINKIIGIEPRRG